LQQTLDAHGELRFSMLMTIQRFAHDCLQQIDDKAEISNWHLTYFLNLAEQAHQEILGPNQFEWLDRLEAEHDNLRAAWDYAIASNTESALRLASALLDFWSMRWNLNDGHAWLAQLLELMKESKQIAQHTHLLDVAGRLAYVQQDYGLARRLLEEALPIVRGSDNKNEIAFALLWLGRTAHRQSDYQAARAFIEECLTIYQEIHDQSGIAMAMFRLSILDVAQGNFRTAEERCVKSLATFQKHGDKYRMGQVLNMLGEVLRLQGDYERAGKFYEEYLEILREQRHRYSLATPLFNLAWVSLHGEDYRKAWALFEESLELCKEYGVKSPIVYILAGFASVLGMTNKTKQAARLFGAVESLVDSNGMAGHMNPSDQKELDHYVATVRAKLDKAEFEKAWAEGYLLTLEQAIAYALEDSGSKFS